MANNRNPFCSTVAIFVIILYILCQFVASIPISTNPPKIIIQSHSNGVTVKISADNQIYEKVTSDTNKAIAEFPTYNTFETYEATTEFSTYNPISNVYNAIVKFFSDIYNAIVKFFSDNYNAIADFISNAYHAIANFVSNAYNAIAEFFRNHVGLIVGVAIGIAVFIILWIFPYLITGFIHCLGFTAEGIAKGSYAAMIMASYGGMVAVKSACAILQSTGALGVKGFGGLVKLIHKLFLLLVGSIFRIITCS